MSFIERLSSLRKLKCIGIIEKGPQNYVLYREVVLSLEVKMYWYNREETSLLQ